MNTKSTAQPADLVAWQEIIKRLPPTLRPMLNQRLEGWELLFPFEQEEAGRFFRGAGSFSPGALDRLTAQLRSLETKMGVAKWRFSEASNTMEDSAMLARSRYYAEWRAEVQRVYSAIESREPAQDAARRRSLILLVIPENLPVDSKTAWKFWEPEGQTIPLTGDCRQIANLLAGPDPRDQATERGAVNPAAAKWWIDADDRLQSCASPSAPCFALSFSALKAFRERFLAELNTIPKDMTAADETMSRLRTANWARWCPPELSEDPRLLHFVIDLFLTGNGALIFPGAFVEWAASEALRRARPQLLVARFGMRSKPKPFTSIAIFENQERVSTIAAADDPANSAIDSAVLARYVWLAATRHREYEKAVCLCVSEHLNSARLIAPPDSGFQNFTGAVRAEDLCRAIRAWWEA